jgi:histone H3/H4
MNTFDAEKEAERILADVLDRQRFSAEVRDKLADHLEQMIMRVVKDGKGKTIYLKGRY